MFRRAFAHEVALTLRERAEVVEDERVAAAQMHERMAGPAARPLPRGMFLDHGLQASPSLRFVPRRWRPFIVRQGALDHAAYELCAVPELRERLRAGEIWVAHSRRCCAFDDYLLPKPTFEALKAVGPLPLAATPRFRTDWPSVAPGSRTLPRRWQCAPGRANWPIFGWTKRD